MTKPLRTPLNRAIGLGSAKEGVEHWWAQRVSALALVLLGLWFVIGLVAHAGADRDAVRLWIHQPATAILLVLLLATGCYHSALGLQVVIEDYIDHEGAKILTLVAMRLISLLLAVAGIFAVLRIAFAG